MAAPTKLPTVTRWAVNQITLTSGFKNRLEPPQSFIDQGFSTNIVIRQLLNHVLYNHGENLDYCMYYNNRPLSVADKTNLPIAADNEGVIYYVSNQKKLVMSVGGKWMLVATITEEI